MKNLVILIFVLLSTLSCRTTQKSNEALTSGSVTKSIDLSHVTDLSPRITETSGLEFYDGQLITHNDSGDSPSLYFLNKNGRILESKSYSNMQHVDWEDVTKDNTFLYIADIGNNYGDRKDLVVYKIKLEDLMDENASVSKLSISYTDQQSFLRNEQNHPYDAESIVAVHDELYLFSKDWKNLTTVVYKINKNKELQNAQKITSHNVKGLITGAAFNGKNTVMLCGYNSDLKPFIIPVLYNNGKFIFQDKIELPISGGAQVEAITFVAYKNGKEIYYLTCEAVNIKLGAEEALSAAQMYLLRY